jgi:EF hand
MKKIAIAISMAGLALAGTAYAQNTQRRSMDADGDGIVTRAEAQTKAEAAFTRMDVNKDGKLDPADRAARRAAHFAEMDANKDGQISRAEFDAFKPVQPVMMGEMGGPDMRGRGGHRMGGHRMGAAGGGMVMRMADANKDGAVSRDEAVSASLAMFDRTDTNKDGKLSAEEKQAARATMRSRMRSGGMGAAPSAGQ